MKRNVLLIAAIAALNCSCQQQSQKTQDKQMMDDQNFQQRREQMQQQKRMNGCCEAEDAAEPQKQTAEASEIKTEKAS